MDWDYIFFDLDGTITDSREGIVRCVKYTLEAFGRRIPPEEELLRFIGPPLVDGFREVAGMDEEEAQRAVWKYRERYGTVGLFENKLYEGIDATLAALKRQGFSVVLATSKLEEYSLRILKHFGILEYFDEVVGSTLDGSRDRKADIIREALRRLAVPEEKKKNVIMVGDRKQDILGAKECGVASLGVYYGFAPEGELEESGADHICRTVEELLSFFVK